LHVNPDLTVFQYDLKVFTIPIYSVNLCLSPLNGWRKTRNELRSFWLILALNFVGKFRLLE
jgi:hypothetical protein